jgi:hypothetical protein
MHKLDDSTWRMIQAENDRLIGLYERKTCREIEQDEVVGIVKRMGYSPRIKPIYDPVK